ncbi:hypothetical protein NJBCHELONAE_26510 [Mycobacteroides chelonae]|jgi:hypothetical protein|nr:hypothetical protein NJBCHELONAE_26510 [Mycobacteroides chelonae]
MRVQTPTHGLTRLKKLNTVSALFQLMGRHESRDTSADNGHAP